MDEQIKQAQVIILNNTGQEVCREFIMDTLGHTDENGEFIIDVDNAINILP